MTVAMNLAVWTATASLGLAALLWVRVAWGAWRLQALPALGRPDCPPPATWPAVSVVVAARDEAATIESAARSLLRQDYPNLEIVIVDDRSTDVTGDIVDRLAHADARVTAIHVQHVPDGWLGKLNALQRGLEASRGALVLFTDADVHLAPGALKSAVAFMQARRLDHLAAIPRFETVGGIVDVAVADGVRALLTIVLPPWRVNEPGSRAFFGVGAFNLVAREAFSRTEGFAYLRMETGDDVGVGMLLRRSGAKCGVASAFDFASVAWHHSLADVRRGSEKVYATLGNCSVVRMLLLAAASAAIDAAPLVGAIAVAFGDHPPLRIVGGTVALAFGVGTVMFARFMRGFLVPGLLTPLLVPVSAYLLLRATWVGWRNDGIAWRGTRYPAADLRAGRRVRIPF
jgi:hypothetical protein